MNLIKVDGQDEPYKLEDFYRDRRNSEDVGPNTFEIALVLGGTVSAGAYTAGFLDFLVQALDTWGSMKFAPKTKDETPQHKVVLKIVTGASGGAVNALLLARALRYQFPHGPVSQNPFYRLWVEGLDAKGLLANDDHTRLDTKPRSLFSGKALENIRNEIANWEGDKLSGHLLNARNEYVGSHLHLAFTLTNLRGVPYQQMFSGHAKRKQYFTQHTDYARFFAQLRDGAELPAKTPPDAFHISESPVGDDLSWNDAALFAQASAAFPFGMPPVTLCRPISHYSWRWTRVSDDKDDRQIKIALLQPAIDQMSVETGGYYRFPAVDGGVMNNHPFELARTWLSGLLGRNPRSAETANRCVIMVDPFADDPDDEEIEVDGLASLPGAFFYALVANNRFGSTDQAMFTTAETRSRMLVAPVRKIRKQGFPQVVTGPSAIASASLNAFGGFLCKAYRHHDFMLGRYNAQKFLADYFVLPPQNPLFSTPENRRQDQMKFRDPRANEKHPEEYRIVPLYEDCTFTPNHQLFEKELTWPRDVFDPRKEKPKHESYHGVRVDKREGYKPELGERLKYLLNKAAGASGLPRPLPNWFSIAASGPLSNAAERAIVDALIAHDLLSK